MVDRCEPSSRQQDSIPTREHFLVAITYFPRPSFPQSKPFSGLMVGHDHTNHRFQEFQVCLLIIKFHLVCSCFLWEEFYYLKIWAASYSSLLRKPLWDLLLICFGLLLRCFEQCFEVTLAVEVWDRTPGDLSHPYTWMPSYRLQTITLRPCRSY